MRVLVPGLAGPQGATRASCVLLHLPALSALPGVPLRPTLCRVGAEMTPQHHRTETSPEAGAALSALGVLYPAHCDQRSYNVCPWPLVFPRVEEKGLERLCADSSFAAGDRKAGS